MVLAPCKKRRMLEVILGQQGPLEQIASMSRAQSQHIIVTRTWCLDLASSRGPLHTYRQSPRPLGAAIGPALEAIVASPVAFGPAEL